jgi:pimeloyl-ACP methyl ester carboxylesterase
VVNADLGETSIVTTADGRSLGVCHWGDAQGAELLWLHGTPGSRLLRHSSSQYRERSLHVVTYDRPGYGLSTRQPRRTVADAAADAAAIADSLGWSRFAVAGVSGGAPHALAVAALLDDRVTRCAGIVGSAPVNAAGLDFYAGMDEESRLGYEHALEGEGALVEEYNEIVEWVRAGLPDLDLPDEIMVMLRSAFEEALRPGPGGYVDDWACLARDWQFSLADIRAPVRLMFAREDTSVPPTHVQWLSNHIPGAEVVWVDHGHFGPRDEEEMSLLTWLGHGTA